MVRRRGDNIPSVSDYAHWNEDAQYMWYEENKYDMQHWDEPIEDDYDGPDYEREWDHEDEFDTKEEAEKFFADKEEATLSYAHWKDKWVVEWMGDAK